MQILELRSLICLDLFPLIIIFIYNNNIRLIAKNIKIRRCNFYWKFNNIAGWKIKVELSAERENRNRNLSEKKRANNRT